MYKINSKAIEERINRGSAKRTFEMDDEVKINSRMKNPGFLCTLFVFSMMSFTACEKEEPLDHLEQLGVLGKWKLQTRTINGITGLEILCCDYLDLLPDSEYNDLDGEFKSTGPGYETDGTFRIDESRDTIEFSFNRRQLVYGFHLSKDLMTLSYSEGSGNFMDDWRRQK